MVLRVDFIKMKISFKKEGRTIELKGMVEEAKLHMMVATKVHKNLKEAIFGFVGQL
jgi:predicted rRNA methylase YqxC with S4 and FtsJ domains